MACTRFMNRHSLKYVLCHKFAGLAQRGEHLPYKQVVGGSSPSFCTMQAVADTAYPHKVCTLSSTLRSATMVCSSMVEHPAVNREVVGSSPTIPASECSIMVQYKCLPSIWCGFDSRHSLQVS